MLFENKENALKHEKQKYKKWIKVWNIALEQRLS